MPPPLKAGLEETGVVSSPLRADVDSVATALGQHLRLRVGRRARQNEDDHQVTTITLPSVNDARIERFRNGDVYLVMHVVHGAFGADPGGTNGNATGSLNTVTRTFCRVGPKASMGKGTVACIKVMELRKALPGPCSIRRRGDEAQKNLEVLFLFDEVKVKEEESRARMSNKPVIKVKAWNEQPPITNSVIKRAQEPLGMLQHAARPIGATVKPGPAVVKVPIDTVTWAHDESLGGISVLETGQGVLVGGGASAGMPRAALVHLIAVCKPKQHQEGTRSLSPAVNAKNRDIGLRPLDDDQCWTEMDRPWSCLVALDSRDASHHLAGLPAHQDGSAESASTRLRKLRWLLPLLCVAALIGAVGGQDVDAASVPSLGWNASYLESEWELETFFASFQNTISDSGEHVRENRECDRLLEEQSRRDAETADNPLEARTPMTAGDVREPPQSTASWASPVLLLLSVGVVLWALVSGKGRAASAKLKTLAARAPATIGTWLKRNKSDADGTERVRIAEAAEAAVAEAKAAAAAAQQETEQAKEAAATNQAKLGVVQAALRTMRQDLEKTRQAKVVAEDSLATVEHIAAEEREDMVSQVDEFKLQKEEGLKALEDQTARAVSAEEDAGELRTALEDAKEGVAREVTAAAGARVEMEELQHQLESALKRLDGAEKSLETKRLETDAALAELKAARHDTARAVAAASQDAASQEEARRAEARDALEASEARSAAAIAAATATAKVATERAEQAEQAAAAALHESDKSSAAAVTAMAAAKSEADGKAAADAAAAKVTSAELARVEEKAAALRREVSVAESAIAEMDDARVKADKEKGLLRARIAALEKDGASASENAEAGRKAVADLQGKLKAEQENGRERVAQQEREIKKLRDMLSKATNDHGQTLQAVTGDHERTVAALANAREEANSLRAKLEALKNRSKQQHADKQRAEQQRLSKPPPGLVQASRSVQASPSPSTAPAASPATGPLKTTRTIPARSVSIDRKAGESESSESAERAKRDVESAEKPIMGRPVGWYCGATAKPQGGSDAGGLPFHGRSSGGVGGGGGGGRQPHDGDGRGRWDGGGSGGSGGGGGISGGGVSGPGSGGGGGIGGGWEGAKALSETAWQHNGAALQASAAADMGVSSAAAAGSLDTHGRQSNAAVGTMETAEVSAIDARVIAAQAAIYANVQGRASQSAASGGVTPPPPPYTGPGARARSPPMKGRQPRELKGMDRLFRSDKPAIGNVEKWAGGYRLGVDPDGNCFGTAWLVAALFWAVQSRGALECFAKKLEESRRRGGALSKLDDKCKDYVEHFISYVNKLKLTWNAVKAGQEEAHGTSLALRVVGNFRGPVKVVKRRRKNKAAEPLWLKLKWGVAIAARALDVWAAPSNLPAEDLSNLQALGESVEYTLGMGYAVFLSMKDAEEAAKKVSDAPPTGDVPPPQDDDAVRPGRGLGLVVGMLVETPTPTGLREAVNYLDFFCTLTKDERVTGLTVLKGGTPHYDVLASRDTPLANALAKEYQLPDLSDDDTMASAALVAQAASQEQTSQAVLEKLFSPEVVKQQRQMLEQFQKAQEEKLRPASPKAKGADGPSAQGQGQLSRRCFFTCI